MLTAGQSRDSMVLHGKCPARVRTRGGAALCPRRASCPRPAAYYNPPDMGRLRTTAAVVAIGLGLSTTLWAVDSTIPQLSELKDGRWQVVEGPATQPSEVQTDP